MNQLAQKKQLRRKLRKFVVVNCLFRYISAAGDDKVLIFSILVVVYFIRMLFFNPFFEIGNRFEWIA